jgi:hypothetical protein
LGPDHGGRADQDANGIFVALRLERGDPPRAAAAGASQTRRTGRNGSSQEPESEARRTLLLYK